MRSIGNFWDDSGKKIKNTETIYTPCPDSFLQLSDFLFTEKIAENSVK